MDLCTGVTMGKDVPSLRSEECSSICFLRLSGAGNGMVPSAA